MNQNLRNELVTMMKEDQRLLQQLAIEERQEQMTEQESKRRANIEQTS
ncbi:hypothetical protein SAMN04487958_10978 [Vreelandella subterranea]|uniref:Uncharacterized protein n=1 Tax=Vreelandella subterranea TaxID=416874 RepID=A0A1H9VFL5_9GAMM|nr:hypothetical protein [Halomonas subterranea]SES20442.1 hypothetical protein SAMN04487958_10978 [Halomonas subterranea]